MINILYTILLFNILIIIFKMFEKYKVNSLLALTFNYITAGICSFILLESNFSFHNIINSDWLLRSISIGILFMVVFYLYGLGTRKVGIAITTLANKMSLIIPVTVAIILYDETFTYLKGLAFFLAISGVYLSTTKDGGLSFDRKYLWLIILVFIGQGISDSIFNDFAQKFPTDRGYLFFIVLFFSAAVSGIIIHIFKSFKKQQNSLQLKSILWGFFFGIPNFFCLVFFLKALTISNLNSSTIFTLVSIGIVVSSSLIAMFFFKEKLSTTNRIGILLCICAIYIFSL